MAILNELLDGLPRTRFGRGTREVPAFRTCGVTGFYVAVVLTLGGGLLAGRSLLVLAALCAVCGLSFFAYALARRRIGGAENLILLEHVWFAEACVAGVLWALGLPVLAYLDPVAVGLCFFLAGGRVGCLLVGCCHGRPSSVGIRYGEEAARDGFPRYLVGVRLLPVPAIEAAALLAIGTSGLAALPSAPAGAVFTWFLVSYSVVRFGLEGLRGDPRPHVLGLSVNRWMCIAELSFAVALWTHEHGGFGGRELVLLGFLGATLAGGLVARAATDTGRRLLSDSHVAEVRASAQAGSERAGPEPLLTVTSEGVGIAVSTQPHSGASHISFASVSGERDLPLLCKLAAAALPELDPGSGVVTSCALHVRASQQARRVSGDGAALASQLYGHVMRHVQGQVEAEEPGRAGYFRRSHAA